MERRTLTVSGSEARSPGYEGIGARTRETSTRAREMLSDAAATAQRTVGEVSSEISALPSNALGWVQRHPVQALGETMALGVVLGIVLRRTVFAKPRR